MSLFGENFPYTNLHDLNLDWIVSVIKEVNEKYPQKFSDLENYVKSKLPRPINIGEVGDILVNIGDDKSEWQSLDTAVSQQIIDAVNEWLNDHPEATTTVQDGAITPAKLDTELYRFYKEMGHVQFFIPPLFNQNTDKASGCTCLMVTPSQTILFDTGESHHATEILNYYSDLMTAGVFSNIDKIIISHYHYDHVENLETILENFPHDNCKIYLPISPYGYYPASISAALMENYNETIRVSTEYNLDMITVNEDTTVIIDNLVNIEMFNSDAESYAYYSNNQYPYNDYSMVTLVKVGSNYAMFPGDLGLEGQRRIMSNKDLPRITFYLVHHHGVNHGMQDSDTNQDYTPYIYKINPLYAIVPADYNTQRTYFQYGVFQKLFDGFLGSTAYDSYSFVMGDAGGAITHGMAIYNEGVYDAYITLYVDNSYTGDIHDGTTVHPFTNINEALGFVKDARAVKYYIRIYQTETPYSRITARDINNNIQIRAFDNSYKPIVESAIIENCHKIEFSYIDFKGPGSANYPTSGCYSTFVVLNSECVISACTLNGEDNTANAVAVTLNDSIFRINTATISNYMDGFRPTGTSMLSRLQAVNLTASHVGEQGSTSHALIWEYNLEAYIMDGFSYSDVELILLGNTDRAIPAMVHRNHLTPAFAAKCTGSATTIPQFLDTTHPIVMIANSTLYDLLTGQAIT